MADTRPTKLSLVKAIWVCLLLLFSPSRFAKEEEADTKARASLDKISEPTPPSLHVRRAFGKSFLLVATSAALGYFLGITLQFAGCASSQAIAWLQIAGACLLLWGTLFVRGWEIQTYCGVTLTERVNQWLYRFLYCSGTTVLVLSLAWPTCSA